MLRRARERRGLTLELIANETKIPQRHLEAFERDNLTAIPSGFYGRAELRTYAQVVGLDQRLALAELESALAPADTHEPDEHRPEKAPTSPLPYIAMAVAAIAVVAALFVSASVDTAPQPAPPVVEHGAITSPAPALETVKSEPVPSATATAMATATSVTTESTQPAVPAPAAVVTELVVTTQPEGARVTVNGIGWGTTPARIQYLEPGEKRVRVSKEGYVAIERVLRLEEGRQQALDIQLDASN